MFSYIASGVSNEVPTSMIEEFVGLIDSTAVALAGAEPELAEEWLELREAIEESETSRAAEQPDDHFAELPPAPVLP